MSFIVLVIYSFVSWCWQQKKKCWMNSEHVFTHSVHTMKTEICWPSDRMSPPFVFVMHQWKKNMRLGKKGEKKECLSPLMDKNYLCLMLVNNRNLPYAICYFYLPKVWQWRHINDETFPVLQRFCQHKSSGNANMWQQFAVFQKLLVQYMYDVFVYFL